MFKFFSTSSEKDFAASLAGKLKGVLPPGSVEGGRQAATVNRITRFLERSYEEAAEYQVRNRLGMFKRAALANHFKWELKNSGYPDGFVEVATEGLVMELSKAASRAS